MHFLPTIERPNVLKMARSLRVISCVLPLFFLSAVPKAQSLIPNPDTINAKLKSHYDQGQCAQGYAFAQEHILVMEGDAAFDFYYGLCAINENAHKEARFAFERLVALYPEQDRFRLEFGRVLFGLKQFAQAQAQFNQVLENDPPPMVRSNIQSFLTGIEQQQARSSKTWSGSVGVSGGLDSNINNATELETFSGITLSDASRSIESNYYGALSNLNFDKKINQRYQTGFRFSTQHKYNSEVDDYDFDTFMTQSYFARKYRGGEWQVGVSYLGIRVNGEDYEQDVGVSTTWRQSFGQQWQSQLTLAWTQKDFETYVEQNGDQAALNWALLRPAGQGLHGIFLSLSSDSARDEGIDERMRDILRFRYRYTHLLKKQWELFAEAGFTQTQYQDVHPLFSEKRQDDMASLMIGTQWRITSNWRAAFEAAFSDNQSNLTLYEYDRFYSKVQVLWSF